MTDDDKETERRIDKVAEARPPLSGQDMAMLMLRYWSNTPDATLEGVLSQCEECIETRIPLPWERE